MRCLLFFALLSSCSLLPTRAIAQTEQTVQVDTIYEVRLIDGSTVIGRIESRTGERIVLLTMANVRMELEPSQIKHLRVARGRLVNGQYWQPDANRTRLFFAPTARSVPAGEGYAGVFMLSLPFVSFGITDRITIAGGAPLLFGDLQPF